MSSPRVCLLITSLGFGGAENQLARLARRLQRVATVDVVSMLPLIGHSEALLDSGISVTSLEMGQNSLNVGGVTRLYQHLRATRPSVLAGFNYHGAVLSRIVGSTARVPVIVSCIRTENTGGRMRRALLRWTDSLGTLTTVNSRHVGARLLSDGVVPQLRRIRVVPNAIDVTSLRQEASASAGVRATLAARGSDFLWVAAGRLDAAKDYPNLIRAMTRVVAVNPDVRLAVAGEGPLRAQLQQMIRAEGIEPNVILLGFRSDLAGFLAAADGMVLSSAWEGVPNAVMEALAVGTPVVATDVGGVRDLIADGESGFIVPRNNSDALAAGMLRLMSATPERRRDMGSRGAEHVQTSFNEQQVSREWILMFQELVGGTARMQAA